MTNELIELKRAFEEHKQRAEEETEKRNKEAAEKAHNDSMTTS